MGRMWIADLINQEENLETTLGLHCAYNCYPPINPVFIPNFIEAINAVNDGDDKLIPMVNGKTMTAWDIIEKAHLHEFIQSEED